MKFRKVTFIDHPILGSVSFDFTDASGHTVDTIILAGENGCGKSLLLSFLNSYNPNFTASGLGFELKVEVEFSDSDFVLLRENKDFVKSIDSRICGNFVTFIHSNNNPDGNTRAVFLNKEGEMETDYAFKFAMNPTLYRTVFSDVEINFTPSAIRHTTSTNLDVQNPGSERSSNNLATEIKQLLIDINELDNEELAKWVDDHTGEIPPDEVLHKRIRRFTRAFDRMFSYKHFVGIDNQDNHKIVLFEEFGRQMEIGQLSSGEKQIVFRGGFLLRNLGTVNGAPILVDEPELSLHPKWQLKILGFLKSLFTDDNGKQTSQLIVATHSPFILHNDTRANDKVLVIQKNDKGELIVLDKPEYYSWSESVAVEEAFDISPLIVKKSVLVFLEGETDEIYFRKAMEVFGFDSNKLSFHWIGHYVGGNKGKAENTGDKALNSAAAFFKANPIMLQNAKVYLLYDCDTNKPEEQEGNLYIGAMTRNTASTNYKIGVENLLQLPADFDYGRFYNTVKTTDDYGANKTIQELDKTSLAQYITSMPNDELEGILINLKTEIEKVFNRLSIY